MAEEPTIEELAKTVAELQARELALEETIAKQKKSGRLQLVWSTVVFMGGLIGGFFAFFEPMLDNKIDGEVSESISAMGLSQRSDSAFVTAGKAETLGAQANARLSNYDIRFKRFEERVKEIGDLSWARENRTVKIENRTLGILRAMAHLVQVNTSESHRTRHLITRICAEVVPNVANQTDEKFKTRLNAAYNEFKRLESLLEAVPKTISAKELEKSAGDPKSVPPFKAIKPPPQPDKKKKK